LQRDPQEGAGDHRALRRRGRRDGVVVFSNAGKLYD
ncbi:hypothetical protein BAE44_0006308, partial [Dichanthelium oligosanthes]